jgi:hypothetical protein
MLQLNEEMNNCCVPSVKNDSPVNGLRPKALSQVERLLQAATAAHFSALGYYVVTDMELPKGYHKTADVAGIRPILKEVKKRTWLGPAPAGVLYLLSDQEWTPTETVIGATGNDPDFARGVLMECEQKGWAEKKIVAEDMIYWRLKDYRYPARESFIAACRSTSPMQALDDLEKTANCCHRSYLVLDYEVDTEFIDLCFQSGIGLMVYVPRNGNFRQVLPPEDRKIRDKRGFMAICERALFENYVLRLDEGGI